MDQENPELHVFKDVMVRAMNDDLRVLQLSEYEILKAFIIVCEENSLTYYLSYGSLLGAKRHKGFIPWDDDVDVSMPRKDFNIFCEKAYSCLPKTLVFEHFTIDETYDSYVPRIENRTVIMEDIFGKQYYAWIDIFPIDGMPKSKSVIRFFHKFNLLKRRMIINVARMSTGISFDSPKRSVFEKALIRFFKFTKIGKLFNRRKQYKKLDKELSKYDPLITGNCVCFMGEKFKDECPFDYYGRGRYLNFEGTKMHVPLKTEEILNLLYGDYMQLPPEDLRNVHNLKCVRVISDE